MSVPGLLRFIILFLGHKRNNMKNRSITSSCFLLLVLLLMPWNAASARDPQSINRQGAQMGEKKQYNEAIDQFDRAIEIYDKESAQTYHNRGWAYELNGDVDRAIPNYEEALHRNPYQVISGEKLGFIYYKKGDYDNAIRVGELVLKYDPENKEVPKWLPDAYLKRMQLQKNLEEERKKKEEEEKRKKEDLEQYKKEKKERESTIVYATIDFMIRTGYDMSTEKYEYVYDRGFFVDIPERIFCRVTPTPSWEIDLLLENPWLGGMMPSSLCVHNETLEGMYKIKGYTVGIGMQFNHYDSGISFSEDLRLWDVKIGLIFGYQKDKMDLRFRFYPRLLPFDGKASKNQTMDVDNFSMNYIYRVNDVISYYAIINWRDYYIMDHTNKLSTWWGVYEFGIGIKLWEIKKTNNKRDFSMSIEFVERLYYCDEDNNKPYDALNGQGWFGLNSEKWIMGEPISGFWTYGHTFGFKFEEEIIKYLFLYQGFYIEMTDTVQGHYEFNFLVGVGGMY